MREPSNVVPIRRRLAWLLWILRAPLRLFWRAVAPFYQRGRFLRARGSDLDRLGAYWNVSRRWRGWETDSLYRARITRAMRVPCEHACAVCCEPLKEFEAGPACRRCGGP